MRTAYTGATLIDGRGGEPVKDACLVVENDRIQDVGKAGSVPIGSRDRAVDCRGKFILPGLIDCHIHLDLHGFGDTYQENLVEDKLRTLRAAREMTDTVRAGFTTVRNVGSVNHIDFAVKAGIEAGYFPGPRIYTAGRIISMTCSGTEYFDGMYRVADGPEECRKAAREQLKAGADLLKVMATGAVMNPGGVPGASQLDCDEMRAIVAEGWKLGRHTAAHAHGAAGIRNAVAAGVRTIEHGTMADDEAIAAMAASDVFLVPTMALHDFFEQHADTIPAFMIEKSLQMQEAYIGIVQKAIAAGVKVALGTDAGTNYYHHGRNAAEILYWVRENIMTPLEAITAATRTASQAIMADRLVGTLETGKMADFLILAADPLADIRILADRRQICAVYKGGHQQ